MTNDSDWIETPPLEFAIRALDESQLHFVLESKLNPRIAPAGVGLRFTAHIENWQAKHTTESSTASYSDLKAFRNALISIVAGSEVPATLQGTGFSVAVARETVGVREGILVTGYCSTIPDLRRAPWLKPKQVARYLLVDAAQSYSGASLQFCFKTSCIAPPLLEQTIRELDAIVQFLENGNP